MTPETLLEGGGTTTGSVNHALSRFLERIEQVRSHGGWYTGLCPAHNDERRSLSFRAGDKQQVIAKCHTGCPWESIIAAVDPTWSLSRTKSTVHEIVYPYREENGNVLFECVRSGKGFGVRRLDPASGEWKWGIGDIRRVPYNLPEVIKAVLDKKRIFVVEGEKDADRLTAGGLVATTNPFGAGKWDPSWARFFEGAEAAILPDNDDQGKRHAEDVQESLASVGGSVVVVELPGLPDKGDVSDWLDQGHEINELTELASKAIAGPRDRFSLLSIRDLAEMPPPEYLIDEFVRKRALNLLLGPSGIGKTFTALDMSLSIASDTLWHGRTVESGRVLYISAEGVDGMYNRIDAWCQAHDQPHPESLRFICEQFDLLQPADIEAVIHAVQSTEADLVVVDPLARFMAGADENTFRDMGASVEALSNIQRSTGSTLLVPHHTGKDASRGERGHSSLRGAADGVIRMKSVGSGIEVKVDKARDSIGGHTIRMYLEPFAESAVLRTGDLTTGQTGLASDERQALEALVLNGSETTSTDWKTSSRLEHSAFQRARTSLVSKGYVDGGGGKGKTYGVTSEGQTAFDQDPKIEP